MEHKLIDGDIMTVNGRQLGDNLDRAKPLAAGQDVIRPLSQPIKSTGHLRILKGNIAPGGCVSKITGKEGLTFRGKARVFDNEDDVVHAIETKSIKQGEKTVIVLRYLGPKGGPGMPEMLKTTSMVMGAGLGLDVACVTDGRFSGGTHGFTVGHVVPEAFTGGNIALIEDGDVSSLSPPPFSVVSSSPGGGRKRKLNADWTFLISFSPPATSRPPFARVQQEIYIDAVKNTIDMKVSEEELAERRKKWVPREPKVKSVRRSVSFLHPSAAGSFPRFAVLSSQFAPES